MKPSPRLDDNVRFDFRDARLLCADENLQGLEIVSQVLMGFGVQQIRRASTLEEFRKALSEKSFDLVLLDWTLGGNGFSAIRWLRTSGLEPNCFVPVIVLAGHTPRSQVEDARDCGANFVIAKPLSANVLLQRILWTAQSGRMFVETDAYAGPDRRFHNQGVPVGMTGRRHNDLSGNVGEAQERNMSQDEVDDLVKPQKMAL